MTDEAPAIQYEEEEEEVGEAVAKEKAKWPLDYKLQLPEQQNQSSLQNSGFGLNRPTKKVWWSHQLYRGPDNKPPEILYSKTKADSETIAKQFLDEPVVGFDMEWPWNDSKKPDLQNKIGLIQIASESKIGLIHIGLHPGKTTDDIIAPSLKKIIEDPKIGKLGVGILSADFARLSRFFHLKPRGAVELSHLYRLVKFGGHRPDLVSTKMVSLANIVEDELGHPLYKGDVRTSDWSKPLSSRQLHYAAGDAYAGYMLYHCMNYKRLRMKPTPPLPIHAEIYLTYGLSGIKPLRLDAKDKDGTVMTSETFYGITMADRVASKSKVTSTEKPTASKPKALAMPEKLTDAASQALYQELAACRLSLATKAGLPLYRITSNNVLIALALQRPTDEEQLRAIKGVGTMTQKMYGHDLLGVISKFVPVTETSTSPTTAAVGGQVTHSTGTEPPSTTVQASRPARNRVQGSSSSSSAASESPIQRTRQLHTGLSFTMAETKLGGEAQVTGRDDGADDSEGSLPSLDFGSTRSLPMPPALKRKRTESLLGEAPQGIQQSEPTGEGKAALAAEMIKTPKKAIAFPQEPLTPRSRIARNKLLAFSKLVTRKMGKRPAHAPPIVSERTLSLIVVRAPKTMEELEGIPGVAGLILACQQTGMDLVKNVVKFVGGRG